MGDAGRGISYSKFYGAILHLISLGHAYGSPLAKFECVLVEEKNVLSKEPNS